MESLKKVWYSKPFVGLEICKCAKNREMAFLGQEYQKRNNLRYINISFLNMLYKYIGIKTNDEEKALDPYHFLSSTKNYNMYLSLASIDWSKSPVRLFSFDNKKRKQQQELFKDNLNEVITDFDGGLDFDGTQHYEYKNGEKIKVSLELPRVSAVSRSLRDLKKAKKIFDDYKIQYLINFSGNRGFHLKYKIPLNINVESKLDIANRIMNEFANILNLKTLDITRLNLRKVFKCEYSVVGDYVVLPLDDFQIDNFNLENLRIEKVMKNIKIKNRGCLWRNEDLPEKESNFKKLMGDFEI